MFFKKIFIFYLPKINKYKLIKAKDISYAVNILCRTYMNHPNNILDNYKIVNYDLI